MASESTLAQELRRNYLFGGLTDDQLAQMMASMRILQLEQGAHLFERDQHARHFFLVRSGQIKLYRISLEGHEKVIETIAPGETFAEAIMFMERQTYPVNADALTASEVIAFDNKTFLKILRESVDTCFRVMADMSMRLRRRLNDIEAISLQNATLRFVGYLLEQLPKGSKGPLEIQLSAPKSVVASRLSVQPESLSRILHNLTEAGLISVKGPTIRIHDPKGLRAYAS